MGAWGPCLGSTINKCGRVGRVGGSLQRFLKGCRGSGGSGESPWLCPASSPHAHITSFTGDGRKSKPPPAAPSPARAADSIESCRNRSPCPASIQGNINYPKTKTRGVHSWGPTLQIPPPSVPSSLLPCCSSSLCSPAIYTVS